MTNKAAESIPASGVDALEAIFTTRAMRRLKPDPIPRPVLQLILDAAIRAPSGGNSQPWAFILVTDSELRAKLGELYRPCIEALVAPGTIYHTAMQSEDSAVREPATRTVRSALFLAHHLQDAPAIIVPCLRTDGRPLSMMSGSAIFPAIQNLMIAARALGVGSTLTTAANARWPQEIRALLNIPPQFESVALIPLGYPKGRWGVAPRRPLTEVAFQDRFGESFDL